MKLTAAAVAVEALRGCEAIDAVLRATKMGVLWSVEAAEAPTAAPAPPPPMGLVVAVGLAATGVGAAFLPPPPPPPPLAWPVEKTRRLGGSANHASFSDRQGVP